MMVIFCFNFCELIIVGNLDYFSSKNIAFFDNGLELNKTN